MDGIHIEDYVEKKILQTGTDTELGTLYESAKNLNWYFDASDAFHQPKGEGYKLVLHCLQKYLDFKFIQENNSFRFQETLFDDSILIDTQEADSSVGYQMKREVPSGHFMDGTRADIYYLLNEADQDSIAARRCINYVNSNKLHLTAVLIQLIERMVHNLERNPLRKYQEYARVLKTVYMTPEYAELDVFSLFEVLGCTKKQYYRLRNDAVTLLSKTLFGILAGEHGFASLYLEDGKIRIFDSI